MIKSDFYMTRADGVVLYRTYSDIGMMIERDGMLFDVAIDPVESGRVYVETCIPITDKVPEQEDENIENNEP